jgi:ribonucleotide reductase beta subunit family protein with ferritin-like domain
LREWLTKKSTPKPKEKKIMQITDHQGFLESIHFYESFSC